MNTSIIDLETDERLDGEDEMEALFASMLIQPPKWLDERILAMAHQAVKSKSKSIAKVFEDLWGRVVEIFNFDDFQPLGSFAVLSAASHEQEIDWDLVLHRKDGDFSLQTMFDRDDPRRRNVMLFFDGDVYEGKEVLLRKDNKIILQGTVKHGQIEALMPEHVEIEPPFELLFRKAPSA